MKVRVERASRDDLSLFARMEQEADTRDFVVPYALEDHRVRFSDPEIVYLRILADEERAGFFILVLDADLHSVEFRRIVVAAKGRGIGQEAIRHMEAYCRDSLGRTRVWLDVFEHNARGRHIYEKLGYRQFGRGTHDGKPLRLYAKEL